MPNIKDDVCWDSLYGVTPKKTVLFKLNALGTPDYSTVSRTTK